jgi:hypothetical protein
MLPIISGAIIYKWKKNLKFLKYSIVINLIIVVAVLYSTLLVLNPSQKFDKSNFENIISQNFETQFPNDMEYISVQFKQERGLLPCQFWTARVKTSDLFYNEFSKEIKDDNWSKETNILDKVTGSMIRYAYKSRYMSGINYEIDFFEDNKTIRIYIIDCP